MLTCQVEQVPGPGASDRENLEWQPGEVVGRGGTGKIEDSIDQTIQPIRSGYRDGDVMFDELEPLLSVEVGDVLGSACEQIVDGDHFVATRHECVTKV